MYTCCCFTFKYDFDLYRFAFPLPMGSLLISLKNTKSIQSPMNLCTVCWKARLAAEAGLVDPDSYDPDPDDDEEDEDEQEAEIVGQEIPSNPPGASSISPPVGVSEPLASQGSSPISQPVPPKEPSPDSTAAPAEAAPAALRNAPGVSSDSGQGQRTAFGLYIRG
jgi:hypothetical protein